ncbi:MAG TPA: phenylalanine--tRNA ligase subunit alpha, partial [Lactococcus lactis]|nr:phenylalanine--tRNA ligase subunit alpha [Lactococcus lactis]
MNLQEKIEDLRKRTLSDLLSVADEKTLNNLRTVMLGKKGELTEILKGMKDLTNEERPVIGALANAFRDEFGAKFEAKKVEIEQAVMNAALESETLDVTLPGKAQKKGSRHILTQTQEEIEEIFLGMGYEIVDGYEVETDHYNFERMNLPKDHPARDMQDTFYITNEVLLRTHTSPMQARTMDAHDFSKGGLRMIAPGRVYRRDTDDATHSHQFHQIEGLVVDKNITMADLKG